MELGPLGAGFRDGGPDHQPTPAYCHRALAATGSETVATPPSPLPLVAVSPWNTMLSVCPALGTVTTKKEMLTRSYCKFESKFTIFLRRHHVGGNLPTPYTFTAF